MKKILFIASILLFSIPGLYAQWNGNPASVDNPVATGATEDQGIFSVTDGSGGAIIVWTAYSYIDGSYSIYAQRKTNLGTVSWATVAAPILLFTTNNTYNFLQMNDLVPDGAGGAYISWSNDLTDTTSDLYLQRINGNGQMLFTAGGIKINPPTLHYYSNSKLCADANGVIITWSDQVIYTTTNVISYAQVFAQRYSLTGVPQWPSGGVQVSIAAGIRAFSEIVSDGSNGAYISFSDARNSLQDAFGDFDNIDIFAQHLNNSGDRLWGATDAVVTTETYNQITLSGSQLLNSMITDEAGGIIIVYEDYRSNNDNDANLYAQRLNSNGTRLWTSGGVALSNPSNIYKNCTGIAPDGANGVITSWEQFTTAAGGKLLAQCITGGGTISWGAGAKLISPAAKQDYISGTMAADGSGNYVFCWSTFDFTNNFNVIKGQKIDGAGNLQWAANGVDICTNPASAARNPRIIRSSGSTMLVAWEDDRNGYPDIYAARIGPAGTLIGSAILYTSTVANGNWNDPATWSNNLVPAGNANVLIQHNVTGNVNATCNILRIISPGVLTVNSGIIISVLK